MQNADTAPFYIELHRVLSTTNAARPINEHVSYRKAVVEGLGLKDSFTSKIKDGTYKPTIDRLVNLANLLNVPPTTFDAYVRRWGHERVEDSPALLKIIKILAEQPASVRNLLLVGMSNYLVDTIEKAKKGTTNVMIA